MQRLLAHNVPQFITHIKDRGGVSNEERCWLQCEDENPNYPMHLILRADEFILYPKDEKTFNHSLFVLTLTLAIMSFVPGGVSFFGLHFCSEIEDFVDYDF
ncbi:hypothetical protein [Chroococcidiopsis sp.]|uniref:hypothetical protein n=1 Tax=Chroococcidiopsis sp. TaxID=3088168 RepID=UPI003F34E69B